MEFLAITLVSQIFCCNYFVLKHRVGISTQQSINKILRQENIYIQYLRLSQGCNEQIQFHSACMN